MRRPALLSLLIVSTACAGAVPDTVSGRVAVTDGDSFEIADVRVRLHAVDAPEGRQTCVRNAAIWQCGEEAAAKLRALVAGRAVSCRKRDEDSYAPHGVDCGPANSRGRGSFGVAKPVRRRARRRHERASRSGVPSPALRHRARRVA
jgi:hypothetical protein